MITTYEQKFINERLSQGNFNNWAKKNNYSIVYGDGQCGRNVTIFIPTIKKHAHNADCGHEIDRECKKQYEDKLFTFYFKSQFMKDFPNDRILAFKEMAKLLDKSILELCYEIKPITVERLNKITIAQWEKWAEKNDLYITTLQLPDVKNEAHLLCKKHGGFVLIEYIISDDHQDRTFIDLLSLINITFDKHDLCNMNKAIHDLVWELETI